MPRGFTHGRPTEPPHPPEWESAATCSPNSLYEGEPREALSAYPLGVGGATCHRDDSRSRRQSRTLLHRPRVQAQVVLQEGSKKPACAGDQRWMLLLVHLLPRRIAQPLLTTRFVQLRPSDVLNMALQPDARLAYLVSAWFHICSLCRSGR